MASEIEKKTVEVEIVGMHERCYSWTDQVHLAVSLALGNGNDLLTTDRYLRKDLKLTVKVKALDALMFGEQFLEFVMFCYGEEIPFQIVGDDAASAKWYLVDLLCHFNHMSRGVAETTLNALFPFKETISRHHFSEGL